MKYQSLYLIFLGIIISSCVPNGKLTLLEIQNNTDSNIHIELWGYPDPSYEENKSGAFNEIVNSGKSFILELEENNIYKKTNDISPVYDLEEYKGFEVFIYRPIGDEVVVFGNTPKDTLHFEKIELAEVIKHRPKRIKIE